MNTLAIGLFKLVDGFSRDELLGIVLGKPIRVRILSNIPIVALKVFLSVILTPKHPKK